MSNVVIFKRAAQDWGGVLWKAARDAGQAAPPCLPATWDHPHAAGSDPVVQRLMRDDLVYVTCPFGHSLRAVSSIHRIEADGRMKPSYVCTATGCSFHAHVRLEGWAPR